MSELKFLLLFGFISQGVSSQWRKMKDKLPRLQQLLNIYRAPEGTVSH